MNIVYIYVVSLKKKEAVSKPPKKSLLFGVFFILNGALTRLYLCCF